MNILAAWTMLVLGVVCVEMITLGLPPVFRMSALIVVTLGGMKLVVGARAAARGERPLGALPWTCFALGWPGMRPAAFRALGGPSRAGWWRHVVHGVASAVGGVALLAFSRYLAGETSLRGVAIALGMIALSLVVHFGVFPILVGAWRLAGADCRPLFRAPLIATSLSEFWSRRWNLAFSEMTAVAVFRPLAARLGRPAALVAAFLFSGALHELAISLPVHDGFGLPTTYFALHAAAVLIEGEAERRGHPLRGWIGRAWCAAWLVAPLPLLFHEAFRRDVLWPLIGGGG